MQTNARLLDSPSIVKGTELQQQQSVKITLKILVTRFRFYVSNLRTVISIFYLEFQFVFSHSANKNRTQKFA